MTDELNEESTTEEIDAKVDEVIASKTEEATAEKSDAQKIAEDGDREAAEKNAEPAKPDPETEETESEETDEREWLDDDLKKQMTAYGIDEDELEGFTSREEVERAMRSLTGAHKRPGRNPRQRRPPMSLKARNPSLKGNSR